MSNTIKHLPRAARLSPGLSRRRFVQAAGLSGTTWWAGAARAAGTAIEAYAGATSVKQGGTLNFFARDPLGSGSTFRSIPMVVVRVAAADQTMLTTAVNVRNRGVPANASTTGCGWPVTRTLTIPSNWPSGLYHAAFGAGNQACFVPFVVRPAVRTAGVNVLVQIPVTTAQAYNNYGGKSLYGYNSTGGVAATKVSFDRPHADPTNFAFDPWQAPFVRWLAAHGIAADFCTSVDLHADAAVLSGYPLFVTAGHDEYWSRPMRDRLDAMVAGGGNAAIFSGNTCWWQGRFESGQNGANRTLVCYKSRSADPDTREAFKTVNWIDLVPPYPENTTFGLGWKLGCSWVSAYPRPSTPYVLQRPEHWAFEGTGIGAFSAFGGAYVGYEADSLQFTRGTDGLAYPTGNDGAPPALRVLAVADATTWDAQNQALGGTGEKSGTALVSIHSRGGAAGAVFNAGTTDWALGLQAELYGQTPAPLTRITQNVIGRLGARHVESADVRRWRTPQINGDGTRDYYTTGTEAPADATLGGLAFRAYAAAVAGSVPIYRYRAAQSNGDGVRYLYNQSATLGFGWTLDGVAFHAYPGDATGRAAVFQHHIAQANGDVQRFLYSPNLTEPGWVFDGVACFAPLS